MKLPAQKIETAAPKNDARYMLNSVYLNVETSELVVTDGRILVKHTVEVDDGDISGIIPLEAFAYARQTKSERITTFDSSLSAPYAYVNKIRRSLFERTGPTSKCVVSLQITDQNSSVRIETNDDNVAVIMPARM